jgi:hypothetical protein
VSRDFQEQQGSDSRNREDQARLGDIFGLRTRRWCALGLEGVGVTRVQVGWIEAISGRADWNIRELSTKLQATP